MPKPHLPKSWASWTLTKIMRNKRPRTWRTKLHPSDRSAADKNVSATRLRLPDSKLPAKGRAHLLKPAYLILHLQVTASVNILLICSQHLTSEGGEKRKWIQFLTGSPWRAGQLSQDNVHNNQNGETNFSGVYQWTAWIAFNSPHNSFKSSRN